jgi:hypothetical protein
MMPQRVNPSTVRDTVQMIMDTADLDGQVEAGNAAEWGRPRHGSFLGRKSELVSCFSKPGIDAAQLGPPAIVRQNLEPFARTLRPGSMPAPEQASV